MLFLLYGLGNHVFAHGVDGDTQTFLTGNEGVAFGPFLYIGAKHMITGYDHLLFLVGVIFFLYRPKEVFIYVSFFTIGHSLTLLLGVMADNPAPEKQLTHREDSVQVPVPAGNGIEYKVNMLKHGKMKYEWTTNIGTVYFDFHGEVKQAKEAKAVYFESYTIAYANNMVGTFLSPYEGKHGWFFRNNGNTDVIVTLRLKGQYEL